MPRWVRWVVGLPLAMALLVSAGTWGYIQFIRGDAPERLTLESTAPGSTMTSAQAAATGSPQDVSGTWKVTDGSEAGYRVKEVLFGQSAEAVGRTTDISGQVEIDGATVTAASFTVDMTTVASDESRRDNQFRGRIMDVATYPTSTFELGQPIELGTLPAAGQEISVPAIGDLTLRGTTKAVTVSLAAQGIGSTIRIAGSIPVVFADWNIPNPSFGPAQTEDRGALEFLLVLSK